MPTFLPLEEVRALASQFGWEEVGHNWKSRLVSFTSVVGGSEARVSVYYTVGTVGTSITHPNKEKRQLFRRNQSLADMERIFRNVRVPMGAGLFTREELDRRLSKGWKPPPNTASASGDMRAVQTQIVVTNPHHSAANGKAVSTSAAHATNVRNALEKAVEAAEATGRMVPDVQAQVMKILNDTVSEAQELELLVARAQRDRNLHEAEIAQTSSAKAVHIARTVWQDAEQLGAHMESRHYMLDVRRELVNAQECANRAFTALAQFEQATESLRQKTDLAVDARESVKEARIMLEVAEERAREEAEEAAREAELQRLEAERLRIEEELVWEQRRLQEEEERETARLREEREQEEADLEAERYRREGAPQGNSWFIWLPGNRPAQQSLIEVANKDTKCVALSSGYCHVHAFKPTKWWYMPQGLEEALKSSTKAIALVVVGPPSHNDTWCKGNLEPPWHVMYEDGSSHWQACDSFSQAIRSAPRPRAVAFGENNVWIIVHDNGYTEYEGIPVALHNLLAGREATGGLPSVVGVSLGPANSWWVRFQDGQYRFEASGLGDASNAILKDLNAENCLTNVIFGIDGGFVARY